MAWLVTIEATSQEEYDSMLAYLNHMETCELCMDERVTSVSVRTADKALDAELTSDGFDWTVPTHEGS